MTKTATLAILLAVIATDCNSSTIKFDYDLEPVRRIQHEFDWFGVWKSTLLETKDSIPFQEFMESDFVLLYQERYCLTPPEIPLPPAILMFGAGLIGLAKVARK